MTVLYLEALAGIAPSLPILMAVAWMVQQRNRQFRLGRYHLGVFGHAGRRRQRAVRLRRWQRMERQPLPDAGGVAQLAIVGP